MKEKLLTICIPTYNRANLLDKQIEWAINVIGGNFSNVNLIILNNASTDETEIVCNRWKLFNENIICIKNEINLGLVGNCLKGIDVSASKFIWLVGDDDPIENSVLKDILFVLLQYGEKIGIVHLNHSCINGYNGKTIIPSFYNLTQDVYQLNNGKKVINELLMTANTGGLMFITANIIRKDYAVKVIKASTEVQKTQLAYPCYLNTLVALKHGIYVISKPSVVCIYNESSWIKNAFEVLHIQVPNFLIKLKSDGISKSNLKRLLLESVPINFKPSLYDFRLMLILPKFYLKNRLRKILKGA